MDIHLLAFGIAKDIVGGTTVALHLPEAQPTIADLKGLLCRRYPEFEQLRTFAIAVNASYRSDDFVLSPQDEVVIIPPVSGG